MPADPTERVLRGLYSAVLYLLLPITVYHLIWRGFRQREYFQRWNERYAVYPAIRHDAAPHVPTVWLHAVSVGEVNAAAPLVNALQRARPDLKLLVTTITPTGSARVRALWGDTVEHVYLPYDLSGAVGRFLAHFQPHAGADPGNRVVAEPVVRQPRARDSRLYPQRAPVGAVPARLSRAGPADRARAAHGAHGVDAVARRCAALRAARRA